MTRRYKIGFVTAATCLAIFLALQVQAAEDNFDAQGLWEEIVKLVKQIWGRITYAFNKLDAWLNKTFGINFTKIIKFIAKIIIWFLELLIKLVKWLIELII